MTGAAGSPSSSSARGSSSVTSSCSPTSRRRSPSPPSTTTGEPSFQIYGDAVAVAVQSVGPRLDTVLERATALVYGSTTLATAGEREVTLRARDLALERGLRVCFDPNIRPNRWGGDPGPAARASRELVAGSTVVRANRDEATAITGVDDPREAAAALVELGAELAVVTLGSRGRDDARRLRGRAAGARGRGGDRRWAPATPSWAPWSAGSPGSAGTSPVPTRRCRRPWMRRPTPVRRWSAR